MTFLPNHAGIVAAVETHNGSSLALGVRGCPCATAASVMVYGVSPQMDDTKGNGEAMAMAGE